MKNPEHLQRAKPRPQPIAGMVLLLLMMVSGAGQAETDSAPVAVIVNRAAATAQIAPGTLRAIFSMRMRQWENGVPVRVYVLPSMNPLHELFCKSVLGVYPYVLQEQWDRLIFTGTGAAPSVIADEQQLIDKVRSTEGAIGYMRKSGNIDADIIVLGLGDHADESHRHPNLAVMGP